MLEFLKRQKNTGDKTPPSEETPQDAAIQEEAPQDTAPQEEAPQDTAPQEEAPQDVAIQEEAPQEEAPQEEAPQEEAAQEETPQDAAPGEEAPKRKKLSPGKIVRRSLLVLGTVLVLAVGGLCGVVSMLNYGPSKSARDLFVLSALESSAGDFLATMFFSKEELDRIVMANKVQQTDDVTNPDMIDVGPDTTDRSKIEIVDVMGGTYKGKMMIVHDPSRVYVGISGPYGPSCKGKEVRDMIKQENAIAGVNGGGFLDIGGVGSGGEPLGIVIKGSQLKSGALGSTYEVIGFDSNNKLVVGSMTAKKALDIGIRDAISFGPILIVNGKPSEITGTGGGLNPRTAIGQRKDGAVLILVIDGRQVSSLGASYGDLIDVMLEYGAVNAANLDGGMSSHMIYEDKIITSPSSLYGTRPIPTAILVK